MLPHSNTLLLSFLYILCTAPTKTIKHQFHNNLTTISQQSHTNLTTISQQSHNNLTTISQQSHNSSKFQELKHHLTT
ncbi:hypothetical protein M758_4G181900 [Ceratodon purpureus]|nr:hypothetical protein M758_4G181900 [Ceratodon purpureus]